MRSNDNPKTTSKSVVAYAVLWKDEHGLPWRREFPATPEGYVEALALELERNRISRAVHIADRAPSAAHLVPILG